MNQKAMLQFIHCADIHIDSPFVGLRDTVPDDVFDVIRSATFRAFENIITLAIERAVDFILIAGDVFDSADRSLRAQLFFRDQLIRAAKSGIHVFIAHGNHDPLNGWDVQLKLPDQIHRFGAEVEGFTYHKNGEALAKIYGISYPNREVQENLVSRFPAPEPNLFTIGVLHCNVGGHPEHDNYAPCTLHDLLQRGYHYWALGHIHRRSVLHENPWVVYPGNTQSRHARESGPRGCFVVHVDAPDAIDLEFIETDVVRWNRAQIDAQPLTTMDDLEKAIHAEIGRVRKACQDRPLILQLTLTGRSELHPILQRPGVRTDLLEHFRTREMFEPFVWIDEIQLQTRPVVNLNQRRRVEDFIGDFLRAIDEVRQNPDPVQQLRQILVNATQTTMLRQWLESLSDDDLMKMLDQAEILGYDLLEKGA